MQHGRLPNSDLLSQTRPSVVRLRVLAWLSLAAGLAYLVRNAVGVAESAIRSDVGLTLTQSGWFMGTFFWTYAIFQVPTGWLAQRFGTRWLLSLFAFAWSTATILLGCAQAFWLLVIAQLLMGAAQAGVFPASCNSISHWIPLGRRSLACAVLAMGMQLGAIAAGAWTGWLILHVGWRGGLVLYALPGLLWSVGFFLSFRDQPQQDARVNAEELSLIQVGRDDVSPTPATVEATPWWAIAGSVTLWLLCGQQMCRAAGYMFFASWFPTFLQETHGVSVKSSGLLQALVFSGTMAGSLSGGMLTDWVWRRTQSLRLSRSGVGAVFLLACAVLIFCAWRVQSLPAAISLLTLGSLFAALAGPCAFSATIDIGGRHVPQVFGVMNMTGNFAAALCPVLVGKLFEQTENWNLVLLVFASVYLLGALCWAFVDPRRSVLET